MTTCILLLHAPNQFDNSANMILLFVLLNKWGGKQSQDQFKKILANPNVK